MIKLEDYKLAEKLPLSLRDEEFITFAQILDGQMVGIQEDIETEKIYPKIERVEEKLLNYLGEQQHIDNFKRSFEAKYKADLIKRSFLLHKMKGTPYALSTAIGLMLAPTSIREWFQYDGRPYYFKPVIDYSDARLRFIGKEKEMLLAIIDEYKNARSWLDGIIFNILKEDEANTSDENHMKLGMIYEEEIFRSGNKTRYGHIIYPFEYREYERYDVDSIKLRYKLRFNDRLIEKITYALSIGNYRYGSYQVINYDKSFALCTSMIFHEEISSNIQLSMKLYRNKIYGKIKYGGVRYGRDEIA